MFTWEKKNRLSEQLKFFDAAKKRFISCYAKKPRIRVGKKVVRTSLVDLLPAFASHSPDNRGCQQAAGVRHVPDHLSARGQASMQSYVLAGQAAAAYTLRAGLETAENIRRHEMEVARYAALRMFP